MLANLSICDLQEAQVDEEAHQPIRNEHVQHLRHHLYATSSRIMASPKMRTTCCSQIWGGCLWMRSPSLWMTINPLDYEDPIAQIFAGEKIDMDSFFESMGPNPCQREMWQMIHLHLQLFQFYHMDDIETLLGIHVSNRQVESRSGIFGLVNGYFGVVEAQGRGSLHMHFFNMVEECT